MAWRRPGLLCFNYQFVFRDIIASSAKSKYVVLCQIWNISIKDFIMGEQMSIQT